MADKCRASFVNSYGQRVTCERDAHEIEDLPANAGYPIPGHDAIVATWHKARGASWSDREISAISHADGAAPKLADPAEIPPLTLAAVVSPGDSLVIGFSDRVPIETLVRVRHLFEEDMPGVKVLVVDGVASMTVVKGGENGA